MSTRKFTNIWDASTTETSGSETGLPTQVAPATKRFQADVGAPARHMNWVVWNTNNNAICNAQHQGMNFRSAKDWVGTIDCAIWSDTNRQWVVGYHPTSTASSVIGTNDGRLTGTIDLVDLGSSPAKALLDKTASIDAFYVPSINSYKHISGTTATDLNIVGTLTARAAARSTSASILISASGTAAQITSIANSGTAATSLSTTTTGFDLSTTATWFQAQAAPGSGPVIFATRGTVGTLILRSVDGTGVTTVTRPDSTHYLGGLAWDDVNSLFVAMTANAGVMTFNTSPDGITWTSFTSTTAPPGLTITGNMAFDIVCGAWLVAGNQIVPTGFIHGTGVALRTFAFYSLNQGATWHPCDLDMATPAADTTHIIHSEDRFAIWTDADVSVSGRLGYPNTV